MHNKRLVIDLDGTITVDTNDSYPNKPINKPLLEQLYKYKQNGFYIVISTARNMRTFGGNVGLINVNTLPVIMQWLEDNNVPYDEILVGKPWCGTDGFYVDDKAIRPSEFVNMTYEEIQYLLIKENVNQNSGQEECF